MDSDATKNKKTIHIVSYSHWDREFRFDFETTRMWFVRLMDNLLSIMRSKPGFKHFLLDGQFGLVDDYLEIRPEKEDELRRLAAAGRLHVGPWYSLPDSSSIHGESLVRNLMIGLRKSREFGGVMELGYNVFSFGQIAQLPQIYAGFGIDAIIFYKNMNRKRSRYDEFIWEAPDGTRALASRLGRDARWNFFFAGHIPIVYDRDPWHKDWQFKWGDLGKTFHLCEPANYAGFHFVTDPDTTFYPEKIREGFERTINALEDTAAPEHLLFFDGTDFTEPHPLIPEIIEAANEELGDEYEIIHSTLTDYVAAIRPLLAGRDIAVVAGEMKDGPEGSVHTDVCSIHPELKRANSLAENLLFRLAEPFATAAWIDGEAYPATHIEKALMHLFKAQAHDSLHGVGPAEMVDDVSGRLLQAGSIAENIAVKSFQSIAAKINTAAAQDTDLFVAVFNGSPFPRTEVVEAYVDVPRDRSVDHLIIEDPDGSVMPMYLLEREETRAGIYHPRSRNMPFYVNRFRVLFEAKDVPAIGYKAFKVKWAERELYPYPHEDFEPVRIPYETLATGPRSASNEFIELEIAPDGTFQIVDKATGKGFAGLNYFLDNGESGSLYGHVAPELDRVITSQGSPARISLVLNTPLMAKFQIDIIMSLPCCFDKATRTRSSVEVDVPIMSEITIRRGSPVIEVVTTVDNKAKDHFLRVCFPTGLQADFTHTGGVFDVTAYSTKASREGEWRGHELARHQQHTFMDISNGEHGLAILNDTLRDYEVVDVGSGTIAQSIVRSVPLRIPVDNRLWMEYPGDDSAQSLGTHTTRYGLLLHEGTWQNARACEHAAAFCTPLRAAQIGRQEGSLPCCRSFLEVKGDNLILSAFKKTEDRDSAIARIYNPANEAIEAEVAASAPVSEAWLVSLNEDRLDGIELTAAGTVRILVPPKKILSIEMLLRRCC